MIIVIEGRVHIFPPRREINHYDPDDMAFLATVFGTVPKSDEGQK